ncbi:MAG: redoxin domain-containing protein [Bacteroidales bacterium]|nr:redoxin domain-containing protein [Bacteroidales bacterium]
MYRKSFRILLLTAVLLSSSFVSKAQTVYDSVTEYFQSLVQLPVDRIIPKIDSLIMQGQDAKQQADIAGVAFDWFSSSKVMGMETVAVHIADNWFLSKKLQWSNPETYPLLYSFAEFNRSSLIGMDAPELRMTSIDGEMVSTRQGDGSYKILYFYDEMCPTCRQQTMQLAEMAKSYKGEPITIYAVNSIGNKDSWSKYIEEYFGGIKPKKYLAIKHLSDTEDSNDYRRKYGVVTTPGMVLVDPNNVIIGRNLNCDALKQLLNIQNETASEYKALFKDLLTALAPADSADVVAVAGSLYSKCKDSRELTSEMMFEYYKYLRNIQNFQYQKGAAAIAEKYIIPGENIWAKELRETIAKDVELFKSNSVGDVAVNVKVRDARGRKCNMLKGRPKYTVLFFHLVTCPDCKREIAILREKADVLKKNKVKVVCVCVSFDEELHKKFIAENPKGWTYLKDDPAISGLRRQTYDIRFVPEIYLLDRNKKIIARDYEAIALEGIVL